MSSKSKAGSSRQSGSDKGNKQQLLQQTGRMDSDSSHGNDDAGKGVGVSGPVLPQPLLVKAVVADDSGNEDDQDHDQDQDHDVAMSPQGAAGLQELAAAGDAAEDAKSAADRKLSRFTPALDVLLLKQVTGPLAPHRAPYGENRKRWDDVAATLKSLSGIYMSGRAARDRVSHLFRKFQTGRMKTLRRRGTEDEYKNRDALLAEYGAQLQEQEDEQAKKGRKRPADDKQPEMVHQEAVPALPVASVDDVKSDTAPTATVVQAGTPRKRPRVGPIIPAHPLPQNDSALFNQYIQLRERELQIEQQRIVAEERRWDQERQDRAAQNAAILQLLGKALEGKNN